LKLGWIVTSGPSELRREAFDRLELIAEHLSVGGTPVQWAASSLLASRESIQSQIMVRVRGNLAFLLDQIGLASPWRVLTVEGAGTPSFQVHGFGAKKNWVLSLLARSSARTTRLFFVSKPKPSGVSLLTPPQSSAKDPSHRIARE